MKQLTIGTKNQIVIPLEIRQKVAAFKPGKKVTVFLMAPDTVVIKATNQNWLDRSYGLLKNELSPNPLSSVDIQRDEWDET